MNVMCSVCKVVDTRDTQTRWAYAQHVTHMYMHIHVNYNAARVRYMRSLCYVVERECCSAYHCRRRRVPNIQHMHTVHVCEHTLGRTFSRACRLSCLLYAVCRLLYALSISAQKHTKKLMRRLGVVIRIYSEYTRTHTS